MMNLKSVLIHCLSDSFEISVFLAFVPYLFGPYPDLAATADEHDVLVYLCVLCKSVVKNKSSVRVGHTF